MTLPTITPLATPGPDITDPTTFEARMQAKMTELPTLVAQINAWGTALPAELTGYAQLASPTFTGTPTLPSGTIATTQSPGDSSTKIATTAFVAAAAAERLAGEWVLITDTTIGGTPSAVDFTGINSTYDQYLFALTAVKPSTDATQLLLRTDSDGGASYDAGASDYRYAGVSSSQSAGPTHYASTGGSSIQLMADVGTASGEDGVSGEIMLWAPSAAARLLLQWQAVCRGAAAGALQMVNAVGMRDSATDVDAVRFLLGTGTFASGRIRLYGRKL